MRVSPHVIPTLTVLVLGWCCLLCAQETQLQVGDLQLQRLEVPIQASNHGYSFIRIRVTNLSATESHSLELVAQGLNFIGPGIFSRDMRRKTQLLPQTSAVLEVPVAYPSAVRPNLRLIIDGRPSQQTFAWNWNNGTHGNRDAIAILASPSVDPRFDGMARSVWEAFFEKDSELGRHMEGLAFKPKRGLLFSKYSDPMKTWSSHPLFYSGFEGLVLHENDLNFDSPELQKVLDHYVQAGGVVLALGKQQAPPVPLRSRIEMCEGRSFFGYGSWFYAPEDVGSDKVDFWAEWFAALSRAKQPWEIQYQRQTVKNKFTLKAEHEISFRLFFLMSLGFVLVVGPLNIVVLRRKHRSQYLLLTVPLISLLTAGAVFLGAFLAEGIYRLEEHRGLTWLDERQQLAVTTGVTALRANSQPSTGLQFGANTELTFIPNMGYGYHLSCDWTDGQRLTSGWLVPREASFFMVRKVETRYESLNLRQVEGKWTITNGFGATITDLQLSIGTTHYRLQGVPIEPGATLTLEPRDFRTDQNCIDLKGTMGINYYSHSWIPDREVLHSRLHGPQCDHINFYRLTLVGAPFFDHPLQGAEDQGSITEVFGVIP